MIILHIFFVIVGLGIQAYIGFKAKHFDPSQL